MRRLVIVLIGIFAILILAALALPFLIDANQFKPRVEAEASKALGREVKVGDLSLSIFSGGVKAQNLSIAENPAYGKGPFLTATGMEIGVEMMPLITSRKLNVQSFTVEQPEVTLIHGTNGKWNVSTLGGSSTNSQGDSNTGEFKVGKFAIHNGRVTVENLGTHSKASTYENVELTASDVSLTSAFPYKLSATPPGGGSIKVSGDFGPLAAKVADETPLTADIKVEKFDLGASGLMDPASGMKGLVNLVANLKSDGKTAKLSGHGSGEKLCLVQGCSPSNTPVGLDFGTDYDLARQTGTLSKGVLKLGNSAANLAGAFDMGGGSATKLNMKVDAANLAVGDIEGILPAIGVVLPSGANLQGGTANAHATIAGPVDALITTGTVDVNNTKLTGYDLGSKLAAISKLAGIGSSKETTIQLFASNVKVSPQGTQANNLKLIVPGIGTLAGDGVIGPKNDLNFKMRAQLQTQGNALGALSQAAGFGGKNADIPFHITGTTSNPVFTPDLGGAVGGFLSGGTGQRKPSAGGLVDSLGGLFGKKKKP
jgi:AsmA protein